MTVKYKTVITKAGAIKLAAATVPNGKKVNFTAMAIGDGGGTLPVPDSNQTKLVNEVWRHALNKISQDRKNKNYVVAELLIPPETGGFWMREMGLYDDTGTLIAVGNMAESYKPALAEGSGRAQTVRMVIMVSDIESVELTIDTSTVMATQDYVDDKLAEHEQSRRHPDATLTAKGFTQLSNATDSTSETLAATPKAVKTVFDLANAKYTAQDATTARKGIVQLSSATDSTSEVLAATPKAVKTVFDLANAKYTAQDATTARKGIVQLSSATDSASEVLAATPKAVKSVNDELNALKQTLGTAAKSDITTSTSDIVTGHVLRVGDYGLGVADGNTENLTSIFDIKCSRIYSVFGKESTYAAKGMPDDSGNTKYSALALNVYPGIYWVALFSSSQFYIGYLKSADESVAWTRYYGQAFKPSAGDVGAVPDTRKVNGKRLNDDVILSAADVGALASDAIIPVTQGGTGATSAKGAREKLYAAESGGNSDITSISGLTTALSVSQGGTGAKNASDARGNISAAVKGNNSDITAIYGLTTALSVTQGGTGAKTATEARANLYAGGISTALNSDSGWWKCADTGRIFQHGKVVISSGGRITFPIAFPNKCFAVILTDNDGYKDGGVLGATTTYAPFTSNQSGTVTVGYLAIGY
ncbi:phage tail protein [Enterobacter cloacae]|uniref:phage tail-collar fiber domain-containing protein n=1 Tax=Enterobacter cloacae TaxID=550 RepID=UPI0032AEB16E